MNYYNHYTIEKMNGQYVNKWERVSYPDGKRTFKGYQDLEGNEMFWDEATDSWKVEA